MTIDEPCPCSCPGSCSCPSTGSSARPSPAPAPASVQVVLLVPSGQFIFARGRAWVSPPAPAPDSPLAGACVEDSTGGVEVAAPVASLPELFSPLPVPALAESGEASLSPSLEVAALPTTSDLATPAEWGDPVEPAGDRAAVWVTKPMRKRPLSGEHEEARGHKAAPSIPLVTNRFEVLAGSEEGADFCTGMDLELASPFPYLDSWAVDNLLDTIDVVSAPAGEDGIGGEEAVPVASSPELFSPLSGTVAVESREGAMSPFLEEVALLNTLDLPTPVELGDSPSLTGEGMAEWATTPARKHASSRDHEYPRGNKSAPSILLGNRYEVLVGSEVGVDMDVELGSLSSFLDGWAVDNLIEALGMDAAPSGAELP
ncbi:hypothetical protein AAFF_G00291460 [Aldrovandia affinis]|uniref:Uncharacterized protein n=1 Tax=Aldrovandia affinis TaxID=143900 RepID=A0AAD7SQR2_9TELE|nr:hypothetical protein AAFF_G00291460 [Aldrovandia affinis]